MYAKLSNPAGMQNLFPDLCIQFFFQLGHDLAHHFIGFLVGKGFLIVLKAEIQCQ
jgi:hypothetical protein